MLGGKFPGHVEENCGRYDNTTLTQLQLIGHVPIQYGGGIGIINYVGNEHAPADSCPIKRVREKEPVYMQQKVGLSLNNNVYQDEPGHIGTLLNPNPVSAGLRLSIEKEEHSPSVSSIHENMKNTLPGVLSLGNTVKMEIDRQTEEFGQYIKLQEENILKGGRELNQRHTISLLNTLEKGVNRKLHEKELEIENLNRKNKELEDRIKQVTMEAQSWHYRAKYNETVANVLKSNIQQLMAQGTAQGREGFGDSEVDDAISCINHPKITSGQGNQELQNHLPKCRACKGKQVSILLFPCRHLCLCADCEGFIDICPICQVMKTASVHVYM
ncbi:hypothetical protein Pfo_020766 [Paulownia fortunei]|nr:hypothetical protein Pfo_020766 [Paulownia fortunei]